MHFLLGNSMTLSNAEENRARSNKKQNHGTGNTSQQSAFNLESMKRSLSGTNYNSLLRPLLQPASSTGLEDRPPPPPAPSQMQDQHKQSGLFTRLQSNSNNFATGYNNRKSADKYGIFEDDDLQNIINNRQTDDRARLNVMQSSSALHSNSNVGHSLTKSSIQQRLNPIQHTKDIGPKPDSSMTVSLDRYPTKIIKVFRIYMDNIKRFIFCQSNKLL